MGESVTTRNAMFLTASHADGNGINYRIIPDKRFPDDGVEIDVRREGPSHLGIKFKRTGAVQVRFVNERENLARFLFRVTPRIGYGQAVAAGLAIGAGLVLALLFVAWL